MNPAPSAALRWLGIPDRQLAAIGSRHPAGCPCDPALWNFYDVRAWKQFAANCLASENTQDIRELDDLEAIAEARELETERLQESEW